MVIEYPLLAFVASLMFTVIVLSVLFLHVYVVNEISRTPVLSGNADARVVFESAVIEIKVIHESGEPVKLQRAVLYTELGVITCTILPRECTAPIEGVVVNLELVNVGDDGTLYPGSTSYVIAEVTGENTSAMFSEGKSYNAVLYFDKGLLVLRYALAYVVR